MNPYHFRGGMLLLTMAIAWQASLAQHGDVKVSHSLYDHVQVIDDRRDTAGAVGVNVIQDYFTHLIADLTDSTAGSGELSLQLRSWSVLDVETRFSRTGINWIRIILYAPAMGDGRRYQMLASLDTVIEIPYGNVFKGSLHKRLSLAADRTLAAFIGNCLTRVAGSNEPSLDAAGIYNIDHVMKERLPVYTADTLRNGVYRSWQSWSLQQPDGDMSSYNPHTTYMLVKDHAAYFFLSDGYAPLVKKGGDFYYIGQVNAYSATSSEVASLASMAASFAGGVPFFSIWSVWRKKDFWMRMDPVSGHFVVERAVEKGGR